MVRAFFFFCPPPLGSSIFKICIASKVISPSRTGEGREEGKECQAQEVPKPTVTTHHHLAAWMGPVAEFVPEGDA